MLIGLGTDIIEIERIRQSCEKTYFMTGVYTEQERRLAGERISFLAGNFAAKEAVSKALATGFRGFAPKDIEVLRDDFGAPYVKLYGYAAEIFAEKKALHMHISISHCKSYASAVAVLEG